MSVFGLESFRSLPKAVLLVATVSLVVHMILTVAFSHTFDSEYWLLIMQNIETGNGLYDINGYYYTPIWGYLLSFIEICSRR